MVRTRLLIGVVGALASTASAAPAMGQTSTPRPRETPALQRAKERADRVLPPASRRRAAAPRTQIFGPPAFDGAAAIDNQPWAGFTPPDGFRIKFKGNAQLNRMVKSDGSLDPSRGITLEEATDWFTTIWDNYESALPQFDDGSASHASPYTDDERRRLADLCRDLIGSLSFAQVSTSRGLAGVVGVLLAAAYAWRRWPTT